MLPEKNNDWNTLLSADWNKNETSRLFSLVIRYMKET